MRTAIVPRLLLLCCAWLHGWAVAADHQLDTWPTGKPVPALSLTDMKGRAWNLASLKGKVVVLNFWATWCEPCRAEMPALAELSRKHSPEQLVVLAVNYQENEARIRRYVESLQATFPVLLDRDGAAAQGWTRRIFPTSIVIGADSLPRYVVTGQYDWDSASAQQLLGPLLALR